jgi:hypothetical protein
MRFGFMLLALSISAQPRTLTGVRPVVGQNTFSLPGKITRIGQDKSWRCKLFEHKTAPLRDKEIGGNGYDRPRGRLSCQGR